MHGGGYRRDYPPHAPRRSDPRGDYPGPPPRDYPGPPPRDYPGPPPRDYPYPPRDPRAHYPPPPGARTPPRRGYPPPYPDERYRDRDRDYERELWEREDRQRRAAWDEYYREQEVAERARWERERERDRGRDYERDRRREPREERRWGPPARRPSPHSPVDTRRGTSHYRGSPYRERNNRGRGSRTSRSPPPRRPSPAESRRSRDRSPTPSRESPPKRMRLTGPLPDDVAITPARRAYSTREETRETLREILSAAHKPDPVLEAWMPPPSPAQHAPVRTSPSPEPMHAPYIRHSSRDADVQEGLRQEEPRQEALMEEQPIPSKDKGKGKELPPHIDMDVDVTPDEPARAPPTQPRASAAPFQFQPPRGPRNQAGNANTQAPASPVVSSPVVEQLPLPIPPKVPPTTKANWGSKRHEIPPKPQAAAPPPRAVTPPPLKPVPVIPIYEPTRSMKWFEKESRAAEKLAAARAKRMKFVADHAQVQRNTRRAMLELELATVDLRAAEQRRVVADAQLELARAGTLGIDAPVNSVAAM